jgi:N-acylneuraminate cytidylyltransferase
MKPLVVIPARGGSKGIPDKNIKLLGGKPLIHYTIEVAREVFEDEDIIVSTDSERIKEVAEATGLKVPFLRPANLATDTAGTHEVLLHALEFLEQQGKNPDIVVLLQPTSPFRKAQHIQEAMELYNPNIEMVVSVKETKSNPYYVLFEQDEHGYLRKSKEGSFTRRQDCPRVWELNGAIYIINTQSLKAKPLNQFKKVKKYVMDELSSHDIDTILDWRVAEAILAK